MHQLSVIETFPQLIGYDPEVYNYFKEQYVPHTLTIRIWLYPLTIT
jgi:hypothetical protein